MRIIQILLLALIVIGLGLIFTQKYWVDHVVNFILERTEEPVAKYDPKNMYFTLDGKSYKLTDGKTEKEIENSAAKETTRIFGEPVYGDLDNDGDEDAAMFLTQNSGGSGTFFYAVEAINYDGGYKGTNAVLLGDRIAPQNINIEDGIVTANFAVRKEGEPMTARPSVGKSVRLFFNPLTGEIGELAKTP